MENGSERFGLIDSNHQLKELASLPDYSNPLTRDTEDKLGIFIYQNLDDPQQEQGDNRLVERPPMELDNGAVYFGQWTQDGKRQGKGVQIWKDGCKYEGTWYADHATGHGRMIHEDGDYYFGDW